jgi:hypothetical protein
MAASVSSERAFLQGGITISKRYNELKGDIVEALPCVKCALHHDLLFREPGPSSSVEEEPDKYNIETVPNKKPRMMKRAGRLCFYKKMRMTQSQIL